MNEESDFRDLRRKISQAPPGVDVGILRDCKVFIEKYPEKDVIDLFWKECIFKKISSCKDQILDGTSCTESSLIDLRATFAQYVKDAIAFFDSVLRVLQSKGNSDIILKGQSHCYNFLGDLHRYLVEIKRDIRPDDWKTAENFYDKSFKTFHLGTPLNQRAIIERQKGDEFARLYWHCRSVSVAIPFSKGNIDAIEKILKKVVDGMRLSGYPIFGEFLMSLMVCQYWLLKSIKEEVSMVKSAMFGKENSIALSHLTESTDAINACGTKIEEALQGGLAKLEVALKHGRSGEVLLARIVCVCMFAVQQAITTDNQVAAASLAGALNIYFSIMIRIVVKLRAQWLDLQKESNSVAVSELTAHVTMLSLFCSWGSYNLSGVLDKLIDAREQYPQDLKEALYRHVRTFTKLKKELCEFAAECLPEDIQTKSAGILPEFYHLRYFLPMQECVENMILCCKENVGKVRNLKIEEANSERLAFIVNFVNELEYFVVYKSVIRDTRKNTKKKAKVVENTEEPLQDTQGMEVKGPEGATFDEEDIEFLANSLKNSPESDDEFDNVVYKNPIKGDCTAALQLLLMQSDSRVKVDNAFPVTDGFGSGFGTLSEELPLFGQLNAFDPVIPMNGDVFLSGYGGLNEGSGFHRIDDGFGIGMPIPGVVQPPSFHNAGPSFAPPGFETSHVVPPPPGFGVPRFTQMDSYIPNNNLEAFLRK